MPDVPSITLRTGPDLLALVPYMIGAQPHDRLVVVFLTADPQCSAAASHPLTADLDVAAVIPYLRRSVESVRAQGVAIAAYGPPSTRPVLTRLIAAAQEIVPVEGAFLAHAGRCFCLTCPCPDAISGIAYDPASTTAACEATFAGLPAPRPATDPITPMQTRPVQAQTSTLLATTVMPADPVPAYRRLIDALENGVAVTARRAAVLAVLLTDDQVRDRALDDILRRPSTPTVWRNVVGHLPDACLAVPGNLAALSAWKYGQPQQALAVLGRVLAVHPTDRMANALSRLIRTGISFRAAADTLSLGRRGRDGRR